MGEARTPRLLAGRSHFSGSYIRDVAGAFDRTEALLLLREGIALAVVTDGGLLDVQTVQPSLEAVVLRRVFRKLDDDVISSSDCSSENRSGSSG